MRHSITSNSPVPKLKASLRTVRKSVLLVIATTGITIAPLFLVASASADPTITEYPTPSTYTGNATLGPDGAVWFTGENDSTIGRITPDGTITQYQIPLYNNRSEPDDITTGPDGALWFTQSNAPYMTIGRITTSGDITEFQDPTNEAVGVNITTGSDGALWITEGGRPIIDHLTTSGQFSQYTVPNGGIGQITAGPDGAMWYVETSNNAITRITTDGQVTEYSLNNSQAYPYSIVTGSDGALWFTEVGANAIGRITTSGSITSYPIAHVPQRITSGPDGALWFTVGDVHDIGRITTSGAYTEYNDPSSTRATFDITPGSDGAMWYTNYISSGINGIGRITVPTDTTPAFSSPATATVNARDLANVTVTTTGSPTAAITESGTLPTGMTFIDNGDGTATLGGQASPVNNGLYAITLTATNSAGLATQTLYLSVNNAQTAPTFVDTATSATVTAGFNFSVPIDTTGNPIPNITKTGSLPAGVRFTDNNDGTASISGATTGKRAAGTYTITLKAKNKNGTVTQDFTLTIQ